MFFFLQLLLHHVIPGFFEISTLQDEMTGVSLAGTQLRVNQYNMHDTEWNDVKVRVLQEICAFHAENISFLLTFSLTFH